MFALKHALREQPGRHEESRGPRPASPASNSVDLRRLQPREDWPAQPGSEDQAAKVRSVYEQVLKLRSKRQSQPGFPRDFQEVNP